MSIRVIAIDDSRSMRSLYAGLLQSDDIEVVATAEDPVQGRDLIVRLKPDVLLLDIEMPRIDGITFLKQLMRYHPMPVLVISAMTSGGDAKAMEALRAGAVDVIPKLMSADNLLDFAPMLRNKIAAAAQAKPQRLQFAHSAYEELEALRPKSSNLVVAIGASTGGTSAVEFLIKRFTKTTPGVVIALHLPPRVTAQFASRLDEMLPVTVKEAEEGDMVCDGKVLIAPGYHHIAIRRSRDSFRVNIRAAANTDPVSPSVNRLFSSVASAAGEHALGVILTGMGDDGARGLLEMRQAGAMTIAEHESSCVVYGMPKIAKEIGAAWRVLPLQQINAAIMEFANLNRPLEADEME